MRASEGLVADLAGAILDGREIDWACAESSAGVEERPILVQLRLLAAVADLHRHLPDSGAAVAQPGEELQQWGPLRVLERIGHGAFGQVYRAWDTRLDREVALKLLPANPPDNDARGTSIIHEGRLLARVRHPNVVTIYGAERIEKRIGLWMELVKGRTLEQVLQESGAFSPAEAIDIGIELCHAMSAVHAAGLLHRDIKAQNVMLTGERRVVLMDFGTGREQDDSSAEILAGTPLYLAPELIRQPDASVRSDIYSIGVLLYHLLTGSYPVRARNLRDLRAAHERRQSTELRAAQPDLPPKLCRIIERAIDPEPARRYDSVASLEGDLAALKPRQTFMAADREADADAPHATRGWRSKVGRWCLLVLLAAGSTTAAIYLRTGSGPNAATPPRGAIPFVAVLPFRSVGPAPVEEYLQVGMADAVITRLSGLKGVAVRPTSAVREYVAEGRDPLAIGQRLRADHVLDATVQRSGDRVRVTTQLVEVATGRTEWAETFDQSFTDLFALQDAISTRVAGQLVSALSAEERRALVRRHTASLEAYELYLRGQFFWEKRTEANLRIAIGYFEQALQRDNRFALAYAGLAHCHYVLATSLAVDPPLKVLPALRSAALKAVELDDQLAEAHTAMAGLYSSEWNEHGEEAAYKRSIELNPNYPTAYLWYGRMLDRRGDHQESLAMRRRAYELDPLNLQISVALADALYKTGDRDAALNQITRTLELDPEFWDAHHTLGLFHLDLSGYADAIAAFEKSGKLASIAHAYARAGDRDRAMSMLRRLELESTRRYVTPLDFAVVYAGLGENDRAFEWLERAFRERVGPLRLLDADVRYAPLRGDAHYVDLQRRIRDAHLR